MTITAAADGSSLGNPGPVGWAWVVNEKCWQAGGWGKGTNNQAELTAVRELLRATKHCCNEELHIQCDSQYVINCLTKWMPNWKRKGWVKADKKPVLNVELLREIDAELNGRNVRFEWVRGHSGHALNERADTLARAVATAYQEGTAPNEGPGFEAFEDHGDDLTAASKTPVQEIEKPAKTVSLEEVNRAESTVLVKERQTNRADISRNELLAYEQKILRGQEREKLLHKDFKAIGINGRIWSAAQIMASKPRGDEPDEFEAHQVGVGAAVTTYVTGNGAHKVRHLSVWGYENATWTQRFHQATELK